MASVKLKAVPPDLGLLADRLVLDVCPERGILKGLEAVFRPLDRLLDRRRAGGDLGPRECFPQPKGFGLGILGALC
jgi:hypothetical protein